MTVNNDIDNSDLPDVTATTSAPRRCIRATLSDCRWVSTSPM